MKLTCWGMRAQGYVESIPLRVCVTFMELHIVLSLFFSMAGVGLGCWVRGVVGSLGPRGGGWWGPVILTTLTSVLAMGFECGHKFNACKTDRDQTCEL